MSTRNGGRQRLWLTAYKEQTGKAINAILTEAVRSLMAGTGLREQTTITETTGETP